MKLEGKVAIVTGPGKGGRGIGRSISVALGHAGADIVIAGSTLSNAELVADAVRTETGRRALALKADVSNAADVETLISTALQEYGRIDILVNNAGITRDTLLMRMSEEDWESVIDINLKGTFLCTKAVTRTMLKQKSGRIVNIASVIGIVGNAAQANYAASKGGMIAFTKSVAKELGPRNITANVVAPGFIHSAMTEVLKDELKDQILKQVPLGRLGNPEDISGLVVFLASDEASYITGQVISVDGGLYM